ncbi:MAG: hypothetical protein HYT76_08805, partial [Deltaproteobacteria bacterium]|nr:hypothetical protein [Deltaproteobacteria bacterium]
LPSHQQLFNKSSSTQGISLNLDANSRSLHLEVGAPSVSAAADGSTDLVDDNWHFLAATIGNGALGAYIDGQREGSGSYPGSPDFSSDVATAPVGLGDVLHYIN